MSDEKQDETPRIMERHAQTVIGGLILLLIGWVGVTLTQHSTALAKLQAEMVGLRTQVSVLNTQTTDRYTERQAARDFERVDGELREIKQRLREIEKQ